MKKKFHVVIPFEIVPDDGTYGRRYAARIALMAGSQEEAAESVVRRLKSVLGDAGAGPHEAVPLN